MTNLAIAVSGGLMHILTTKSESPFPYGDIKRVDQFMSAAR